MHTHTHTHIYTHTITALQSLQWHSASFQNRDQNVHCLAVAHFFNFCLWQNNLLSCEQSSPLTQHKRQAILQKTGNTVQCCTVPVLNMLLYQDEIHLPSTKSFDGRASATFYLSLSNLSPLIRLCQVASSSSSSSSINDHWPQSWLLLSFLVHAELFCCFHSPPNSDMD